MKLEKKFSATAAILIAFLGYAHEHGPACGTAPGHAETKFVSVSKAVQETMGLKTVRPEMRRMAATFSFPGRYELDPDARKVVSSPVAGRLSLAVRTLQDIRKGDELFTVTSPELVSREREISVLEKRLDVYRQIKTPNAALENELAVKRAEREAMLADAEEKNGVVTVRATTDGMVETLIARDGAWLETGAAVVQTIRPHQLRFKALVAARDAIALKDGMKATQGKNEGIVRIGPGDGSGLIPVYVIFDKDIDALSGSRELAECVTDESEKPHTAVPSSCIVNIALQPTVFIRDEHDEERFIAVPVKPGASRDGWTMVEGIDSRCGGIVSDGAYELKQSLLLGDGEKSAGHFHADGSFHEQEH
jgi:hypothetical protein